MKAFETVAQFIFVLVLFVVAQLIFLGITLDFARIQTLEFWVEVLGQFILTMTTFNMIYSMHRRNKSNDPKGRFFQAYMTNRLRIRVIEDKKLYDALDKAVEDENLNRLKRKCNKKIYRYCSRLCYDDVITDKPIDELFLEYRVITDCKWYEKAPERIRAFFLRCLIKRIRAGKIIVRKLHARTFLTDKELSLNKYDNYDFNTAYVEIKRNIEKAFTFILCSIITSTVVFSFVMPNFWIGLVKNITFVLSGITSGFSSAIKNVKLRTSIYENRNQFLKKNLDISDEFISNVNEVSKK